MTILLMLFRSAFRNRLRSILTVIGVALTIVAFLSLRTMVSSWSAGATSASADRLVVRNKVSMIFPLPNICSSKIKNINGVTSASWASWFGGIYKDPRNFFAKFAVDAESYLHVYPEISLSPAERDFWLSDRTGCVVGAELARQNGWKMGDSIAITGDLYPGNWKFTIRGIFESTNNAYNEHTLLFHWKYLDEMAAEEKKGQVGTFVIRVVEPTRSAHVAHEINGLFANSPAETRTETEKAFQLSFLALASTILIAINIFAGGMLVILVLILANTMAMATRERTYECAVLRVLGFRPSHIVLMVLAEGVCLAMLGALVGVVITPPILSVAGKVFAVTFGSLLGDFHTEPRLIAFSLAAALAGSILATAIPAWRAAARLLADALRRSE